MNSIQEARIRLEEERECTAVVVALNEAGMTLQLAEDSESTPFMWVHFEIPNQGGNCTALCEVIERSDQRVRVRFKHLFPRERRALESALSTQSKNQESTEFNVA